MSYLLSDTPIDRLNQEQLFALITEAQTKNLFEHGKYGLCSQASSHTLRERFLDALIATNQYELAWLLVKKEDTHDYHQILLSWYRQDVNAAIFYTAKALTNHNTNTHRKLANNYSYLASITDDTLQYFSNLDNFANGNLDLPELQFGGFSMAYSTYDISAIEWQRQLQAFFDARTDAPEQGDRPVFPEQTIIYGDHVVEGNLYLTRPLTVLGNLTVTGSILANDLLNVAGSLQAGAIFSTHLLCAKHIQSTQFVACYRQRSREERRQFELVCDTLTTPLLLLDIDDNKVFAELSVDHVLTTERSDLNGRKLDKLLKPECFRYSTDTYFDLSAIDDMARRGTSIFMGDELPWHDHDYRILPDPNEEPLTTFKGWLRYLPPEIIEHRDTLTHLHIDRFDIGRVPPYVLELKQLTFLEIGRMGLTTIPDCFYELPHLAEAPYWDNPTLINRIPERSAQSLLKFNATNKVPAARRKKLFELLLSPHNLDLSTFSQDDMLAAFKAGGPTLLKHVIACWQDNDKLPTTGDVISVLGKTNTKAQALVEQFAAKDIVVLINQIAPDTTFILLGNKPSAKALKNFDHAIPKLGEKRCLDALKTQAAEQKNTPSTPTIEPGFFQQRVVVVAGKFNTTNREAIVNTIRLHGAVVRQAVTSNTDLLILGHYVGRKTNDAAEHRVDIWREDDYLAALASLPDDTTDDDQGLSDPLQPNIEFGPSGDLGRTNDKPVQYFSGKTMRGDTMGYAIQLEQLDKYAPTKGAETLLGLHVTMRHTMGTGVIAKHLVAASHHFTNLKSLALGTDFGELNMTNLSVVLEAFPKLVSLYCANSMLHEFEPTRHPNLQQLTLNYGVEKIDNFMMCSLPNLAYLVLGGTNQLAVLESNLEQQFPQLKHIGLTHTADPIAAIEQLKDANIKSLSIAPTANDTLANDALNSLINTPLARRLERLHFTNADFEAPELINSTHFPALTHLGLHGSNAPHPDWIEHMVFDGGIHLDLSLASYDSSLARQLVAILPNSSVTSLNLDHNSILSKQVQADIMALPIPTTLWNQRNPY